MTAQLTEHLDCDRVRGLVAKEVVSIEQAFARRAAAVLLASRPRVEDLETRIAADTFTASARMLLRQAGLPTHPEEAGCGD